MPDEQMVDDWSAVAEYEDDELEPAERVRVIAELLTAGVMRLRRARRLTGGEQHSEREPTSLEDVEARGLDRSLETSTTRSTARETESGHG